MGYNLLIALYISLYMTYKVKYHKYFITAGHSLTFFCKDARKCYETIV